MSQAQATPRDRERTQATLSIIGDVSVAASEAMRRPQEDRRIWKPIVMFGIHTAAAGLLGFFLISSPERVRWVPLVVVVVAALGFWDAEYWKRRGGAAERKLSAWQEALNFVGHESANAVNAIRANLSSFRLNHPTPAEADHLEAIDGATQRIEAVIQRAQDPPAWKAARSNRPS